MHQQVVQASETAFEMRRLGQQVMRHGVDGAQKKRSSAIQLTNLSCKQVARCQSWTFLDLLLHRLDLSRPGVKVSGPCTVCGLCARAVQRHLKDGQKHDGTGKRTWPGAVFLEERLAKNQSLTSIFQLERALLLECWIPPQEGLDAQLQVSSVEDTLGQSLLTCCCHVAG